LMFGPQPKTVDFSAEVFPPTLEVLGMFASQKEENEEYPEDEWEDEDYVRCFKSLLLEKGVSTLPSLRMIAHPDNLRLLEPLVQTATDRGVHVALTQTDLESLPI
ncbi:10893_t:CDS:1, partial [Acaulospora colombiana]